MNDSRREALEREHRPEMVERRLGLAALVFLTGRLAQALFGVGV